MHIIVFPPWQFTFVTPKIKSSLYPDSDIQHNYLKQNIENIYTRMCPEKLKTTY